MPAPKDPVKYAEYIKKLSESGKRRFADPKNNPMSSEESRKKASESAKRRCANPEWIKKESERMKNWMIKNPKHLKKLIDSHTESGFKKISESAKERYKNRENTPMLGKHHTPEVCKRLSEHAKERYKNPENNPFFGKRHSEETRHKIGKLAKERFADPQNHPMWKNGASFEPYSPKFNTHNKRRCRHRFGRCCAYCHKTREQNGRELSVHHVYVEKLACSESEIAEMDVVRNRFPPEVARFGEPQFSEEEIMYIRMWVPLCGTCHGHQSRKSEDAPYEKTRYRKFFTELILNVYGGRCLSTDEEMNPSSPITITISPQEPVGINIPT